MSLLARSFIRRNLVTTRPTAIPHPASRRHVSSLLDASVGLKDEQREYLQLARGFADKEFAPQMSRLDAEEADLPHEVLKEAAKLGFAAVYCSPDYGGTGLARLDASIIFEALATGDVSTTAYLCLHNMCCWMIDTYGTTAMKEKYMPAMVSMEKMGSYCLTEPDSGSDAASLTTTAVLSGSHYVLNGSKVFVSGGGQSDIYMVMARTGEAGPAGVSCFLVEKGSPGLEFGGKEKKMGWNSQPTRTLIFDDCKIPKENLLGNEGQGFRIAMKALDGTRINMASCSLGGAQAALEATVEYTKTRKQFQKPLSAFQNTQFQLSNMLSALISSRLVVRQAACLFDESSPMASAYCALAKLEATERCYKICDDALQLHGGYGYLKDYPVQQYVRDLRVHRILGGTNEVMRLIASRMLLKG